MLTITGVCLIGVVTHHWSLHNVLLDLYWAVRPSAIPFTNSEASTASGILSTCFNVPLEEYSTVRNVHDIPTATAMAKERMKPVLFKQFRQNPTALWGNISSKYSDTIFETAEIEHKSFGNFMMAGTRTHTTRKQNVTMADILKARSDNSTGKQFYASFASFLDIESTKELLGQLPQNYKRDTNFISNFDDHVMASPIHSTSYVTSYALQLLGKKIWIFIPPEIMEEIGIVSSHTANYHYQGSERVVIEKMGGLRYVVAEEGDLVIFPPLWGHVVVSHRGPNVMFNLRERTLFDSFLIHPVRFLRSVVSSIYLAGMHTTSNALHSTTAFNSIQHELWRQRDEIYKNNPSFRPPESGCRDLIHEIFSA